MHDTGRVCQIPYIIPEFQKGHSDEDILQVQLWMEKNYAENLSIDDLAKSVAMTKRTFERRFKSATKITPLLYLQKIRIEVAKNLLETTNKTFDQITYLVGYEDSTSFRRMFYKRVKLLPKEYRKKFMG